jgi:hypothetical protein
VPVGERNSYLHRFRRFNISSNPIGWIAGFYGLSASYALNNHVAIRGDVNIYNIIDSDEKGNEIGVGVPLYLRRTYQGAFLEPGFIARTWDDGYCDEYYSSDDCDSDVTFGPQMLFGWHWTWESGFNLAMAAGLGRNLDAEDGEYYDQEELFFNGYFRVGYAF